MICFLIYSPQKGSNISKTMGQADYSYYFVMQRFLPVLRRVGLVHKVRDPMREIEPLKAMLKRFNIKPLLLSFAPPHKTPVVDCPTFPVFAWEYSSIPTESWDDDESNNWQFALSRTQGAITHSEFAMTATRAAMGNNFPLCSLPAPVWDAHAAQTSAPLPDKEWVLQFSGVLIDSHELGLQNTHDIANPALTQQEQRIALRGVVYAAVLNPNDGRKNWHDTLWAFCWAFRDNPSVTLLIKAVHHDVKFACELLLHEMKKLAPYQCRVIIIHGFLDDETYQTMINGVTYIVNSSYGEGQCLPLMEFMSAGKPAIAPNHSAMADYLRADNSFILHSWPEWTHWPHDSRLLLRTFRYQIDWQSLFDAYIESYAVATMQHERYLAMSKAASQAMQAHCSQQVITDGLKRFLKQLGFSTKANRILSIPPQLYVHIAGLLIRVRARRQKKNDTQLLRGYPARAR